MSLVQASPSQNGNPLLKSLSQPIQRDHPMNWDYYVASAGTGVLFVTVRYHMTKSGYLEGKLRSVAGGGQGCLVCMYDAKDESGMGGMEEINKLCFRYGLRLLVAWDFAECARWIEGIRKKTHHREKLKKWQDQGQDETPVSILTAHMKPLRKKDAETLLATYNNIATLTETPAKSLAGIPGIGTGKIEYLRAVFTAPLITSKASQEPPKKVVVSAPASVPVPFVSSAPSTKRQLFCEEPLSDVKRSRAADAPVAAQPTPKHTTSKDAFEKMLKVKDREASESSDEGVGSIAIKK
eukprot:TRINITY_DN9071_c0_g2_i1.p1 TRINITY_DN9071_c0_g2~~TRINITY_DN9071_c0_g2_i1.p1  ORF type:complete len:295 (+),score=64.43 TRINITY_DN9071_c0_g2_i1:145-1029(+)